MRKPTFAFLFLTLVATVSSIPAFADSFTTFDISGTFASGSTLAGTITLDETSGIITSADVTASAPDSFVFNSSFNGVYQSCTAALGDCEFGIYSSTGFPALVMGFVGTTFVGYDGGALGSTSDPANGSGGDIEYSSSLLDTLTSGSLTATPEPSSLLLMGSGLLAFAGMVRRKLKA